MQNIFLQKLQLENYRNFASFEIEPSNNPVILIGENGSGKTNILESISLLFPGKGMKSARLNDICRIGQPHFTTRALVQSKISQAEILTHFKVNASKRSVEFNGSKIPNNDLSKLLSIIWLTPQMDGIFLEAPRSQLKFFDRIVYNFIPAHAATISKYEYYLLERSKILAEELQNLGWLKIIEEKIAETSLAIIKHRSSVLQQMQQAIDNLSSEVPKADLRIDNKIGDQLDAGAVAQRHFIQTRLVQERCRDRFSGRTNFGVHRSDFIVTHRQKNLLAKFCSTGEQKALLISIILAQVNGIISQQGVMPIILLDEVFAHLDYDKKQYLIEFLVTSKVQFWISATDLGGIEKLISHAQLVSL